MSEKNGVDVLHLTYLRSAQEWYRSVARSMLYVNAGGVFVLIGVFTALLGRDDAFGALVSDIRWSIIGYTLGIVAVIVASWAFSHSDHKAAWGSSSMHVNLYRIANIGLVASILFFGLSSWFAVTAIAQH